MKAFFLIQLLFAATALAQMPETDIWLFKLEKKDGKLSYTKPLNITNRAGYDNQPCFSTDGKSVIYVSVDSTKQADIFQYSISKKKRVNLTKSTVSEYSPTILPGCMGFSAVVVERDSAQRIWQFHLNGIFNRIVHEPTDSVGYHSWLNADTVLYYKLTEPHSLRALDLKTNKDIWICDHPVRSFKKVGKSSKFMYGIKDSTSIQFRVYDPVLKESRVYATYPSTHEDFIWHPDLGLVKSENAELLWYNEQSKHWQTLFDFSAVGIKKITRFVFDVKTKQFAIVSNL
jgi:hypothetical protein